MTLDGWSSLARDPYLGVTVHWVHSAPESPTEWSLRTLLLAFREVKGNHSGENLANLVMEIIDEVGLSSKVCAASYKSSRPPNSSRSDGSLLTMLRRTTE